MRIGDPSEQLTPIEVLGMPDREIDATFEHWYVPKRNMRFVRRNALVVLGNVGTVADLGVLAGYLGHPDSLLRGHAAWAVGTIGGSTALRVLEAALLRENDPAVVTEITSAIAATSAAPVYADAPKEPTNGSTELE
jgi:epoxyqueuosine reductase